MQRLNKLGGDLGQEQLQFTTDKGCLTIQQRRFYEENGFLIVRNFLKHDEIDKWTSRFRDYCSKAIAP